MNRSRAAWTLPHAELEHLAAGRWHEQRCGACGALAWHPRLRCPTCWATELVWTTASDVPGVVMSYATVHRPHDRDLFAADVPITLVAVARRQAAGVIAVGEPQARPWRIGEPVQLRMERRFAHGLLVPVAKPEIDVSGTPDIRDPKEDDHGD